MTCGLSQRPSQRVEKRRQQSSICRDFGRGRWTMREQRREMPTKPTQFKRKTRRFEHDACNDTELSQQTNCPQSEEVRSTMLGTMAARSSRRQMWLGVCLPDEVEFGPST